MKTLKISLKTIALFFMALMLLQSCVAYKKNPVSLLQAEQSKKRVKVKTNSNQIYHFKQIVLEEDQFYGLKKEKGEIVKIAINNNDSNKAFLQNKGKSIWITIAVIAIPLIIAVTIIATTADLGVGVNLFEE